jgi:serine/threonine-protein kinase
MTGDPDWAALDAAFDRALALDGPDRDAFLGSLDASLRARLGPLLADALADDPLFDHPAGVLSAVLDDIPLPADIGDGARVGPYRIETLVGEGGMGRVYRARRADGAFDQTVAVKVVRTSLALAGTDVAARLRRERDLLAALDHPGIARLVDGGETDDGVPYLVTEFVDGTAITDYAHAHTLSVGARVRLLVDVARAVEHAHRRLVVHRDLKPSNVLVTERDGEPRTVVLDFGIAKLLASPTLQFDADDGPSGAFPLTQPGVRLLTPAYAAPELYDPAAAVTTAADVYGLGALLYELLTDRRPHDDAPAGPPTAEPTKPSKAVTTLSDGAPAASDLAARSRLLQGDLDTICLKALHPDMTRRYASASDFADDLSRYLDGRPIEARRDSLAYVAGRFVRRHRASVLTSVVALVALIGGLGASLVSLRSERTARAEAEVASQRAHEAATLLAGVFQNATPSGGGRLLTVREALDAGLGQFRAVHSDDLRAYLLGVAGVTYAYLSEPDRADSLLAESLALYGESASDTTVSKLRLMYAATRDAFADHETALALARRVYADQEPSGYTSPLAGRALSVIARAHLELGQPQESFRYAAQAVALARQHRYRERLAPALLHLGMALSALGHHDAAVSAQQEAVQRAGQIHGPTSFAVAESRSALAQTFMNAGRYRDAERTLRIVQADQVRDIGPSISLSYTLSLIGSATLGQRRYREAAAILDSAIVMGRPTLPPGHHDLGIWLANLAAAHNGAGAYREAETAAREALRRAEDGANATDTETAGTQLARALDGLGRPDEARVARQRAERLARTYRRAARREPRDESPSRATG